MSLGNQCQKCNKLLWDCNCRKNKTEEVYKNLHDDFSRTDIERHSTPEPKKQFTVFDLIASVSDLVETIPNDIELGAAVRKLFAQ